MLRSPRWVWLGLLLALLRPESALQRVRAERPMGARPGAPNLLIIIGDDHGGGTLGIDGDPRQATPRLDALARHGIRFDRAYCNAPVCTPSRQSFITGRLPHAVGVTLLPTPLPDDALTLGDWLGGLGYATAAFGKMHFNSQAHHGFTERIDTADWLRHLKSHPPAGGDHRRPWRPFQDPASVWLNSACQDDGLPFESMQSTFYANTAREFFRRRKGQAEPFALVVSLYDPHSPFRFPREWKGRYSPEQFPVPPVSESDKREQPRVFADLTPREIQGIQAAYYTSLSYMDHVAGQVLDGLDESGLADNTIVVYLGDNGYMRGQHGRFEKHCFYEPAVRVPFLLRWPGHLPANQRISGMVELVDLVPTLLELARVPAPPGLHGHSLAPLMLGQGHGRDVVFSEYLEDEEAMVRSERYKLIVGTGRRLRQDGYATGGPLPGPYERLYDTQNDPDETTDLGDRPELASIRDDLRQRLFERLTTTRDGIEPVPEGLSPIEAIHWCLIPRDRNRTRRK